MPTNRIRRLLVLVALLAASLTAVHGTAGADPTDPRPQDCWTKNTRTGVTGPSLGIAIHEAAPGDRVRVHGTCYGPFGIGKDITLHGPGTLSALDCYEGHCFAADITMWVGRARVKFKDLVITEGYSTHMGGGIYNDGGHVILSNTAVRGNWAEDGGGGILNYGTVQMNWSSSVTDNWLLFGDGGGIRNHGTLIMNGWSRVERNEASRGGGIYSDGRVVLNRGAIVTDNRGWEDEGGGLLNEGGTVSFSPRWHGSLCGNDPDDWPTC